MAVSAVSSVLGLDIGEKRVGVALANSIARIAHPLTTLEQGDALAAQLQEIITRESVSLIVAGLPRNLNGDETPQTRYARQVVAVLEAALPVPIVLQDEALTSRKAEQELSQRKKPYRKEDIDALAATYILEDYLREEPVHV